MIIGQAYPFILPIQEHVSDYCISQSGQKKNHSRLINASNEAWAWDGSFVVTCSRRAIENEKRDVKEKEKEAEEEKY